MTSLPVFFNITFVLMLYLISKKGLSLFIVHGFWDMHMLKKSVKLLKGQSESVNQVRGDNPMTKWTNQ
jgi:hypothetical protein